ncbi:MAG TPA: hypothetical protein VFC63_12565 [Blastocatellia bacterium]|nr:hypothetical protein [Blastocatellia bacterium]
MIKIIFAILLSVSVVLCTQTPDNKSQEGPELKLDKSKPFISPEGKFSIALPQVTGDPVSWDMGIGKFTGQGYTWHMAECSYTLYFADRPSGVLLRSPLRLLDAVRRQIRYQMDVEKGKNIEDMPTRLGVYPGREFRWETQDLVVFTRAYVALDRIYVLTANVPQTQPKEDKSTAAKTLSTFKILEDGDIKRLTKKP